MPAPSEPEKYSIDQMMDRLKNRPAEDPLQDGELVIRADGTKAIKVRKRKRRSRQPHKEMLKHQRRARMLQVSGVLILLLLAAFAIGSGLIYANSAPFREKMLAMIRSSTGAEVELEQFRVNPANAVAGRMVLTWPEGAMLHDLNVRGVSAAIAPSFFLGKSLKGEEVTCSDGILRLRAPDSAAPALTAAGTVTSSPIHFKRFAIPSFTVRMGNPAQPPVSLVGAEASFQPVSENGRPQLLLNRGEILLSGWPKIKIDRSHIEFRDRDIDIVGMRLMHEDDSRGVFELSGTVTPFEVHNPSLLDVRLDSFPFGGIAGPELGQLFAGRIDTETKINSNYFSFTPGADAGMTLEVSFRNAINAPIELQAFPFLNSLALMLGDNWFERPVFETGASGRLRRVDASVALDDLEFEQKARMALRGGLALAADRQLTGRLEIGITEVMIRASGNRKLEAMFGPVDQGFRWLALNITGTGSKPVDDFLKIVDATLPAAASPAPEAATPSFEDLTRPD
jgi:hypothetical protein